MKIFSRDGKINFVDDNNVFVGYGDHPQCCEQFGWFITDSIKEHVDDGADMPEENFDGWNFDTQFKPEQLEGGADPSCDKSGGILVFRMVRGTSEKFLHIYNFHNGCYSHGWEHNLGGEKDEGYL